MESRLTRGNIVIVPELICMAAWQYGKTGYVRRCAVRVKQAEVRERT
ncbi:hypothetical protein N9Z53_04830 [Mariniblastus sp.]|nr:hypothetical protein [Mariniblastus sp.]